MGFKTHGASENSLSYRFCFLYLLVCYAEIIFVSLRYTAVTMSSYQVQFQVLLGRYSSRRGYVRFCFTLILMCVAVVRLF